MNVPKLRFKDNNGNDYPQWKKKKLGDIGDIVGGGTPSSSNEEYWNGNINWFTPSEIGKTKFVSESIRKITTKGLNNSSAKLLPKGTILLSSRATIGEKSILLNPATTNQGFQSIITNDKVVNEFIYYYIDTLKKELIKQASGSTFLEISNTIVKKLKIYIPLLEEQNKIAKFFSTVDKKIANLEDIITNLEKQKKGLLQQIFNQKLRFKDENGNNYPDWEKKKLGDIGNFSKGGNLSKSDLSQEGFPCILYGELYTHYNEFATEIKSKTLNTANLVLSKKYDVLLPLSGETAEDISTCTCIFFDDIALGSDLLIFRSSFFDGRFMSLLLKYKYKYKIAQIAQGKSIVHISAKNIKNINVKIPCLEEQQKIADFILIFTKKLDNQKAQLEHWKQIKKGLLQQMFV